MRSIAVVVLLLAAAAVLGVFIGVMPWVYTVGLTMLVAVLALFGRSAIIDLSVLLVVALGIIPIPGRSKVDAIVLLLMVFMLLRSGRQVGPMLEQHKRLIGWVAGIVAVGAFSLAYGLLIRKNDYQLAYSDARFLLYWGMLPVALVVLRERLTVRALALTITVFGAVLGFIGLVQSVTRTRLLLSEGGRVESLQNTISTYDDVTRSIVPGTTLVSFVFFLALARLLSGDAKVKRIWWWLVLTLTAGGILVNFGRTLWVATIALAIVILFRAGNGVRAFRVLAVCSMLAVVASVFVYVTKPIVFESIVDRVVSSREEGRPSSSWSWRKFENQFAVSSIQSRPLLGVGMGGDYKPFQPGLGKFDDLQSSYIHNSYLFLPLKLGVPAALLVLAVLGWLTVRLNRSVPDMVEDSFSRSILLACGASALQFMGMAYIQPQFNAFGGVLVFAIVAGLSESIRSSEVREPASTASKSKRRKSIDAAILRHVSPKV